MSSSETTDLELTRLDKHLERILAQRDMLNLIAAENRLPPEGDILELGLGNGRTYSHLRARFAGRRIVAFDRAVASHASSTPEAADVVLGEISQTAAAYPKGAAAMVHADIATGYEVRDTVIMGWLPQLAVDLLQKGGIALAGLPLIHPQLVPLDLPEGIGQGRYYAYAKSA